MISRFIQWILSKLFPYNGLGLAKDNIIEIRNWDKLKFHENEEFYGGQDGTVRN